MCQLIMFPSARRVGFIRKHARDAAGLDREAGDNTIRARLNQQRAAFLKRGIPEATVEREMKTLESAIRAAMWHHVMAGRGAA
jgi:hypothetical protein